MLHKTINDKDFPLLLNYKLDDKMYPLGWRDESRTFPVFYSGLTKYKKRAALMVIGVVKQSKKISVIVKEDVG